MKSQSHSNVYGENLSEALALAFSPIDEILSRIEVECEHDIFHLVQDARLCWDWAANARLKAIVEAIEQKTGQIEIQFERFRPFNCLNLPIKSVLVHSLDDSGVEEPTIDMNESSNETLFNLITLAFSPVKDLLRRIECECSDEVLDLVEIAQLFGDLAETWLKQIIQEVENETGRIEVMVADQPLTNLLTLPILSAVVHPKGMSWQEILQSSPLWVGSQGQLETERTVP